MNLKTKIMEATKIVTFKGDTSKVKFFANQTANLRIANSALQTDFAGAGYDPDFDAGIDGFISYLEELTDTNWNEFSDEQVEVIKDIFHL
jgi:hypothetical protein